MKKFSDTILAASLVILGLMTAGQQVKAQTAYKLVQGKEVNIKVLGSSNVHDWQMASVAMESQGDFIINAEHQLTGIPAFGFSLDAKSLKSEHQTMDERTYKTMKADQYPKVVYKLTSAAITEVEKGKYTIKTTGRLTIAGVTQTINMAVHAVVNADNTIVCTGSEPLKLTDYKIEPPSFMLGAMKVKNDLTIQFNLVYKSNPLISKTN